jgi:voltage-gated sodium channel|tara:strand:- start:144 stop:1013 length:870 start_codon:yes stop_codon:yes gene_type:complete
VSNNNKQRLDWLISEPLVLTIIGLNAVAIVLSGFSHIREHFGEWITWVDYGCLLYFVAEAILKIRRNSFTNYWKRGWNKLDFIIVLGSSPLLLEPIVGGSVQFFSIVLVGRFLRFLRIMRFVPNSEKIWAGVSRALKASAAVFLTLLVLNIILAMGANALFGDVAPKHFGDPLKSAYTLFKVFTVEGWYEIPEEMAANGEDGGLVNMVRGYFVFAVFTGGILGLSLANAVFVDEMIADNNDRLEKMVTNLREELADKREQDETAHVERWKSVETQLRHIQEQLTKMSGG